MLRVYLMDKHGSPRLVRLQPAPINDPVAINGWLSVFSIISQAKEGTEMRVGFRTDEGTKMTAFVVPGDNMIDIGMEENDIKLYMYARNIIPDTPRRI